MARDSRAARAELFARAAELGPYLAVRSGESLFMVRTADQQVGRSLFVNRTRGEMKVLARAVRILERLHGDEAVLGRLFVEVGANIGTTTVPALVEHGFGAAIAFEPEPESYRTLCLNAAINELDGRLTTVRAAASNAAGHGLLAGSERSGGKHWLVANERARKRAAAAEETFEVETVRLDDHLSAAGIVPASVGMLWLDVQGHEGHVLEGAQSLVAAGVPVVLEWDPSRLAKAGGDAKVLAAARAGYTHFVGMRGEPRLPGLPRLRLRPVSELAGYVAADRASFTDVMLLRVERPAKTRTALSAVRVSELIAAVRRRLRR